MKLEFKPEDFELTPGVLTLEGARNTGEILSSIANAKHSYRHEMTNQDHERLVAFIQALEGMVILCGYAHPIYEQLKWREIRRESHADGARDRVESLWINPAAVDRQKQIEMVI